MYVPDVFGESGEVFFSEGVLDRAVGQGFEAGLAEWIIH